MSVFLKAINLIANNGWTKGKYFREYPGIYDDESVGAGYCIVGACAAAANMAWDMWERTKDHLLLFKYTNQWPTTYNDSVITNKDEAIKLLERVYYAECELAKQTEHSSAPPA